MGFLLKEDRILLFQLLGILLKSCFFVYLASDMTYSLIPFQMNDLLSSIPLYLSIYLTFLSFAFLTPYKGYAAIILNFIFSLILFMDFVYFRAFGVPSSWFALAMVKQLGDVGDSVFDLLHLSDFLFFIDVFIWSLLLLFFRVKRTAIHVWKFVSCLTLAVVIGVAAYPEGLVQKILKARHRPIFAIQKVTPIGYHLLDSYEFIRASQPIKVTNEDRVAVHQWFIRNNQFNNQVATGMSDNHGIFQGKNVIFIHFESLENCVINQSINGQEITPQLNKLLTHSYYFPHIKEQVGEGNSADGEFMVFNSLYPLPTGIISLRYPSQNYFALPKELIENGYVTAAFLGMEKGFMNMAIVLPNYGFQHVFSSPFYHSKEKIGLGIPDHEMVEQTIPYLKKLKKPFFAYLITLTNHVPYKLPSHLQTLSLPQGFKKNGVSRYLQSVHYTDQAIGSLIEGLKREGLLDETVLVIYGDHQGVNKYYAKDVKESELPWLNNDKNVPLLIYHPSLQGIRFDQMGGQVDILPTVRHLLGLKEDPRATYRVGRNLFLSNEGFAVLRNEEYRSDHPTIVEIQKHRQQGIEMSTKVIQGNLFQNDGG